MKQTIKSILAFAAVLFCGGAWAEKVAEWTTFTTDNLTQGDYVIAQGDCTIANGVVTIPSSGNALSITKTGGTFGKAYTVVMEVESVPRVSSGYATLVDSVIGSNHVSLDSEANATLKQHWNHNNTDYGTATGAVPAGGINLIVFAYNGASVGETTYVNGEKVANGGAFASTTDVSKLVIGAYNGANMTCHAANMRIYRLAIYSTKLTDTEVAEVYEDYKEVPNATMSVGFDGGTAASSIVGGTAPTSVSEWNANSAEYTAVRGSTTDKAMQTTKSSGNHAPYASKPSGMADSSSWTVNIVAKLPNFTATTPNDRHVIWGVSGAVWSNGAKGIGLVYTAANTVALEYVAKNGGNNSYSYTRTVLVDNVEISGLADSYHVYTVTYNASALGTAASPFYTLYVDGVQKGTSGTTAKQTGYVDNWCVGNYYGGALQVRAAYADGMYVDDFAIWGSTCLSSVQAHELAKKFPYTATVSQNCNFSEITWSPELPSDLSAAKLVLTTTGEPTINVASAFSCAEMEVIGNVKFTNQNNLTTNLTIPQNSTVAFGTATTFSGKILGEGTLKWDVGATTDAQTADKRIESSKLAEFSGTFHIASGRYQPDAVINDAVSIKVSDGGQLWVSSGTWANAITVSGNGWRSGSEAIEHAAIRCEGATLSGAITAEVVNLGTPATPKIPIIGTYNSNAVSITGNVSCSDGLEILAQQSGGTVTLAATVAQNALITKTGNGTLNVNNKNSVALRNATVTINAGTVKLNSDDRGSKCIDTTFVMNGGSLDYYGWPTFEGTVTLKSNLQSAVEVFQQNQALHGKPGIVKQGSGTIKCKAGSRESDGIFKSIKVEEGVLEFTGTNHPVTTDAILAGEGTLQIGSDKLVTAGAIGGTGNVNVTNGGTLKINGAIDCSGSLNVSGGTVELATNVIDLSKINLTDGAQIVVKANVSQDGVVTVTNWSGEGNPPVTIKLGTTALDIQPTTKPDGSIIYDFSSYMAKGAAAYYDWTFTSSSATTSSKNITTVSESSHSATIVGDANAKYTDLVGETYTSLYNSVRPYNVLNWSDIGQPWSIAIAGKMSKYDKTCFASFGGFVSNTKPKCFFLATGESANDVRIIYVNSTSTNASGDGEQVEIVRMDVPNARETVHTYVISLSADGNTVSVYLDGEVKARKTRVGGYPINNGFQVSGWYGGTISGWTRDGETGRTDENSGLAKAVRVFQGEIGENTRNAFAREFPYVSPSGTSERTLTAASEDWDSENAWTIRTVDNQVSNSNVPKPGSTVILTATTAHTLNVPTLDADVSYEKITIQGAGSIAFENDAQNVAEHALSASDVVVNIPITINKGILNLAVGRIKVGDTASVTFDFSGLTDAMVFADYPFVHQVTGLMDEVDIESENAKLKLLTLENMRSGLHLARNVDGYYEVRSSEVTPIDIYYISGYLGETDVQGEQGVFQYENGTATSLENIFRDDVVIVGSRTTPSESWISPSFTGKKLKIEKNYTLHGGETATYFGGATITVADDVTLTLLNNGYDYTLGAVTFNAAAENGSGIVKIASTMSAGAIAGTAKVEIADGATLTPTSIANTVIGAGTLQFVGEGVDSEAVCVPEVVGLTADTWTGTFEIKNWNGETNNPRILTPANYGNTQSSLRLNGYKGYVYYGTHAFKSITIGENGVIFNGSYSNGNDIVFKADTITGSGAIDGQVSGGNGTMKFVGNANGFSGSVTANTKYRLAFVATDDATLPAYAQKTIIVGVGETITVGSGKTWTADGGVLVAGTLAGSAAVSGPMTLTTESAKATVASVTGAVTTTVDGYSVVYNEVGSAKVYELMQNGGTPPEIVIPQGTTEVSLVPGQEATYTGDAPTTITVKIPSATGSGPAYDVTDYCTITTADGTITTALKDDQTTKPTVNAMAAPTEASTDKVAFTITSPIPGLFYAVSSCDTPNGDFTSATGDQATSDAAKTVSIPMTFTDGKKVKYYKVSVKATK